MKVDACDAACSMDHKISGRVPIHLYNRSTKRLRLGWIRKSVADDIRLSKRCSRLPVLPSAK